MLSYNTYCVKCSATTLSVKSVQLQHSMQSAHAATTLCVQCLCSYDVHSLCKVFSYDTFCAKYSAAIISVYSIQLPPSLSMIFSCNHLCVQYSAVIISVYSIQLPSSLCTVFSCNHLCVQYSAAIISEYDIQLQSSPCQTFC